MLHRWTIAPALLASALLLLASPTAAQPASQCREMFNAADSNDDDVLSENEIFASNEIDGALARAFSGDYPVTWTRFQQECGE